MKKILVTATVIVIVFTMLYVFYTEDEKIPAEAKLMEAFESTGATALSREIYFWAGPDVELDTLGEYEELITALCNELGITGKPVNRLQNDNISEIQISGRTPDGDMLNISGRIMNRKQEDMESHLIIDIAGEMREGNPGELENRVMNICSRYGIVPRVNYCITGYFEEKLDTEGLNEVCKNAFNATGARKVDGIKDNNLISLTAYSPELDNYIRVDGSRINLNIAIRYNSYEKRTYIWLATPLINIDY